MIDLSNKKGLIVGVANDRSVAWGCAKVLHAAGAKLAITYGRDKTRKYVEPLLEQVPADIFTQMDITNPEQRSAFADKIKSKWGSLDFLIHSVAFAPADDLHGRVVDASRDGFLLSTEISCYSLISLIKTCEPLMTNGGSILTMTYYGSQKVMPMYGIMGPMKALLEAIVKYTAAELGKEKIRVNAISPGPLQTRAASGISDFDKLLKKCHDVAPLCSQLSTEDVGNLAAFLVSDLSKNITGDVHYVDCGYNVMS